MRSALVNKVTPEDIEDIVILLLLKAKQGDLAAVKLLFSYVLPGDHVPAVIGACHAELVNGMARVTIPPVQDSLERQLADILAVDLPVPLDPLTQAQLDDAAGVEKELKAALQEWMIRQRDFVPLPVPPPPQKKE